MNRLTAADCPVAARTLRRCPKAKGRQVLPDPDRPDACKRPETAAKTGEFDPNSNKIGR
jgi:hypothetical protein